MNFNLWIKKSTLNLGLIYIKLIGTINKGFLNLFMRGWVIKLEIILGVKKYLFEGVRLLEKYGIKAPLHEFPLNPLLKQQVLLEF